MAQLPDDDDLPPLSTTPGLAKQLSSNSAEVYDLYCATNTDGFEEAAAVLDEISRAAHQGSIRRSDVKTLRTIVVNKGPLESRRLLASLASPTTEKKGARLP